MLERDLMTAMENRDYRKYLESRGYVFSERAKDPCWRCEYSTYIGGNIMFCPSMTGTCLKGKAKGASRG